jgi:hypothetical protein
MNTGIQYISDEAGDRVGVIIPIELWESTTSIREPGRRCDLSEYYGVYRDVISDPDALAQSLCDEWGHS